MNALSWKAIEKRITEWLNSEAIPAIRKSKMFLGENVEDIEYNGFSIEVKSRGVVPKYIDEWLRQATHNCGNRVPVIFWHRDGMHSGEQFVVLKAKDFKAYVERKEGAHELE
jgi:predicted HTH domain antitoxin